MDKAEIFAQLKTCCFCKEDKLLTRSHIIPQWVRGFLEDASSTRHFRHLHNVNKRVEDLYKPTMLCRECNGRFGIWESQFKDRIYDAFHQTGELPISYGPWLLKFAVSISWMGLTFFKIASGVEPKLSHLKLQIDGSLNRWHDFLSGKSDNPGKYTHHLIPIRINPYMKAAMSTHLKTYLYQTVHFGHVVMGGDLIQHTKLGRISIVGVIDAPGWGGVRVSRLRVRNGIIPDASYGTLPVSYFDTLNFHADEVLERSKGLSEKQRGRIERDSLKYKKFR